MSSGKVYEGTLDEITEQYGGELRGHRLRVQIDDDVPALLPALFDAPPSVWAKAFREWAIGHKRGPVQLSDGDVDREAIYEGRI